MSMYVEIRKQPRMHNGVVHRVGSVLKLPNSMALALINRGYAVEPTDAKSEDAAVKRAAKRSDAKAERSKARSKAKKDK